MEVGPFRRLVHFIFVGIAPCLRERLSPGKEVLVKDLVDLLIRLFELIEYMASLLLVSEVSVELVERKGREGNSIKFPPL